MRQAMVVREVGGPEVMALAAAAIGEPGVGQVRVAVEACGVNFIDVYFRTGLYPRPLPFAMGLEGAGRVEALGEGADGLSVGDRVAWASVPGSYADAVLAPAASLVPVPDGVDTETAAAVMLQGMTAHYLTHGVRETRPGDTALVHAAAGGTGLLLVQLLKAAGARVIGTCSSDEKESLAREAGADEIVRYTEVDVPDAVRGMTEGLGVDVVYDSVGQATFEDSLRCLRVRGLCVCFGQSSGPVPPFDMQRLNQLGSLSLTRPSLAHFVQNREELEMRADAVLGAVGRGELHVRIGERFPLSRAADAHRALEGRRTTGKVVLLPGG